MQNICTTGNVLISANNDMTMTATSSIGGPACGGLIPSNVTLIVDNQRPILPLIGPGVFNMIAGSEINTTGSLRIYTAFQNVNTISATLNGAPYSAGTPFADTCSEQWCTYYCGTNNTCPFSTPFSIFYKNCFPNGPGSSPPFIPIFEFLVGLHPYNEYPGWMSRFTIEYAPRHSRLAAVSLETLPNEHYYLRRRHLNVINHPKTWTQLIIPEDLEKEQL